MTRSDIENNTTAFFRKAKGTRPDVRLVDIAGRRVVVKDFIRSDPLFRFLIGPFLIRRESKALARLAGIDGVPRLYERIDRYSMVMEYIDGENLWQVAHPIPLVFFDQLIEIIEKVHASGVTHCDLRSPGNVIMRSDGSPVIVDFAANVMRGRGLNPFINFVFSKFVSADNRAILILKRKVAGHLLSPEETQELSHLLPFERTAKQMSKRLRKLLRSLLTK